MSARSVPPKRSSSHAARYPSTRLFAPSRTLPDATLGFLWAPVVAEIGKDAAGVAFVTSAPATSVPGSWLQTTTQFVLLIHATEGVRCVLVLSSTMNPFASSAAPVCGTRAA